MTISQYACEDCGYAYEGCGGLGVLASGTALQTVSCADCLALHDVDVGVNLWRALEDLRPQRRGPGRRVPQPQPTIDSVLATLAFACPVDASHAVRAWTDGTSGWTVPAAVVSACPVCRGHIRIVRTVMLAD